MDKCFECGDEFGVSGGRCHFVRCPVCWLKLSLKKDVSHDVILTVLLKMHKAGVKIEKALLLYVQERD